ncbi:MAG TPA: helicase-related protein [Pirellulales bacterium]|nr:helicase-related protein [Pirellulales bacterium]
MPRIFDNIDQSLLPALRETLALADRSDFCVGYFNLRGWKQIDELVERWSGGAGKCCRLLVGMHRSPDEELREALSVVRAGGELDNQTALRLKKTMADEFGRQLRLGTPTNHDEIGLRRLAAQIRAQKVIVKLFLEHPLHAKLYLLFRPDPISPTVGYLGSSNLTFAGLAQQGELNVDVVDHDACQKLARWFDDRWNDRWCLDISAELARVIDESWARPQQPPPYHIYLKMAYHLSREAREGVREFRIPADFGDRLFEFQVEAVKIAAHHLNKRGGVMLGDVVGLGKTLIATAVARICELDHGTSTLILCPKNLVKMWEEHALEYGVHAKIVPFSRVIKELPDVPARFRLVIVDESHNLRNREGRRYHAIYDYIRQSRAKVVLVSATPYNKMYLDLASQLRLFLSAEEDIGMRPEALLRELGEGEFERKFQCKPRTLAAFEKSTHVDDWRELMGRYLVRRTRSFIEANYAETDAATGRKYLTFADGRRFSFPKRVPKTVKFAIDDDDPADQYAQLYSPAVVDVINRLSLPRYGLGNYEKKSPDVPPTQAESRVLADLSRAGKRLMGFCRTNLFKRLESSGHAFLQSLERHILRNHVFLQALDEGRLVPIGPQDAELLDTRFSDADTARFADDEDDDGADAGAAAQPLRSEADFRRRAAEVYAAYAGPLKRRFKWLRSTCFVDQLAKDLRADAKALLGLLNDCGAWDPARDAKLNHLAELIGQTHRGEKLIVFTQFADTVDYLARELRARGIGGLAGVSGDSEDPTRTAWRFSPESNDRRAHVPLSEELTVLIATDVLSEGQNLQDAAIVVNYDLPWAIIRLIQRAGRVDRIGQRADVVRCYSFLPAEGVDRIIRLRSRVRRRLRENAEVVGSDEAFFEDDRNEQAIRDLFTERAGILDGDAGGENDLTSEAYQIWKNAVDRDPSLRRTIETMPDVVYSTRSHQPADDAPDGVLVYVRTSQDNDALAWIDRLGRNITESQTVILKAAHCEPDTPALARLDNHHELVESGVRQIASQEKQIGGGLGSPRGARFRAYERLKRLAGEVRERPLFPMNELRLAVEEIYNFPLRQTAVDTLNRQLRSGIGDEDLAHSVIELRAQGRLCIVHEQEESQEPRIICSLGLRTP